MKPHLIFSPAPNQGDNGGSPVAIARKVLAPQVPGPATQARVPVGADANVCRQPQVTVHKQGTDVTAIEVLCSCGERITIELTY
jgi:hypothetical protein